MSKYIFKKVLPVIYKIIVSSSALAKNGLVLLSYFCAFLNVLPSNVVSVINNTLGLLSYFEVGFSSKKFTYLQYFDKRPQIRFFVGVNKIHYYMKDICIYIGPFLPLTSDSFSHIKFFFPTKVVINTVNTYIDVEGKLKRIFPLIVESGLSEHDLFKFFISMYSFIMYDSTLLLATIKTDIMYELLDIRFDLLVVLSELYLAYDQVVFKILDHKLT